MPLMLRTISDKPEFQGIVHIFANMERPLKTVSGIVILNNSYKHIKPIVQVLEVYQSSNGNQSESIGKKQWGWSQARMCHSEWP